MMKKLLTIILIFSIYFVKAQTVDEIDKLRFNIFDSLDQYDCFSYLNDSTLNENPHQYDTAYFYVRGSKELVYFKLETTIHYYHMQGDYKSVEEYFFMQNQLVFRKGYSYSFENSQWHKEPDIKETKISISEYWREYYKIDGEALLQYRPRETKGKYKNRFTSLDSIPLEQELERRWTDRCDSCYEEYMEIFNDLISDKDDE